MVKPNPEILCADPLNAGYDAEYRAAPGAEVPRPLEQSGRVRPRTALRIGLACLVLAAAGAVWWAVG